MNTDTITESSKVVLSDALCEVVEKNAGMTSAIVASRSIELLALAAIALNS